jgi:hypothetical protein
MKFDRSLGSTTPGISASAQRATLECTAQLLWLTGHSPSSASLLLVLGSQTLRDRLSWLVPGTSWPVGLVKAPRLPPTFEKDDAFL